MSVAAASRPRSAVHWPALLAATVAAWLPIVALHRLVAEPAPGTMVAAEWLASTAPRPPAAETLGIDVGLPDDWHRDRPGVATAWYRLRFGADRAEPHAVYLPSVAMSADVWVNGERVGGGALIEPRSGEAPAPVARNWNRPLLFRVPSHLLRGPDNVLAIRVVADRPGGGFLAAPAVAPLALLAPVHARTTFVRRTLLWMLVVVRLAAALFTAVIFVLWRREAYYGWFALCMVTWVLAEVNLLAIHPPLGPVAWSWLYNVAIGWWGITAVRLVLSFIGVAQPAAERRLLALGIAGPIALGVLAASGWRFFDPLAVNCWLTLAFGASLYLFRGVLPRLRSYPDAIELNVVFVVALAVVGCVLFDLTVQLGLQPRGGLTVPPYASLVAVVGMGWVLVRRFVGALTEARALALTLEERVRAKSAEVEASYGRILATDRARVLAEERERILRDTDEGLGAQLVSTLALLERPESRGEEIQASVRAALDDLRLVVDSLDPTEGDLPVMLGMLRSRMQPRFDAAGIGIAWQVADLPPLAESGPHRTLQILRIVQSVFADALARDGGGTLAVAARGEGTGAVVEIARSPGGPSRDPGRMRARAREIGATIEIREDVDRAVTRLVLPLGPGLPVPSPVRGIAVAQAVG
jgi:signal transduction histidine kinase